MLRILITGKEGRRIDVPKDLTTFSSSCFLSLIETRERGMKKDGGNKAGKVKRIVVEGKLCLW